ENTALLGPPVAAAFVRNTRQTHHSSRGGGGEMAPTAAPGGRGRCAYACARSEFRAEGARREGRGRSYLAPAAHAVAWEICSAGPAAPEGGFFPCPLLFNVFERWGPQAFDAAKDFIASVMGTSR
ncbi:unnamed protein product, partial [Gulo gulo]